MIHLSFYFYGQVRFVAISVFRERACSMLTVYLCQKILWQTKYRNMVFLHADIPLSQNYELLHRKKSGMLGENYTDAACLTQMENGFSVHMYYIIMPEFTISLYTQKISLPSFPYIIHLLLLSLKKYSRFLISVQAGGFHVLYEVGC